MTNDDTSTPAAAPSAASRSSADAELAGPAVLLFPGQGAYDDAAVRAARPSLLAARDIFESIDAVASRLQPGSAGVTDTLLSSTPRLESLLEESADRLQLVIFGLSVATHRTLAAGGVRAGALAGHSFGEIAALVAGGAFTVEQGAELVCHRNAVLHGLGDERGAMVALGCPADRAAALLQLLDGTDVVVAADNSPVQSVVAGGAAGLSAVQRVAAAVPISLVPLRSPYAFHSPVMAPLVSQLASRIRQLTPGRLHTPVYSAILGRWYQDGDDYAELLASHLVRPVRFRQAVQQLVGSGARIFVEVGARSALTSFVRACDPSAAVLTTLHGRAAAEFPGAQVRQISASAATAAPGPDARLHSPAELLLPGIDPVDARTFWAEHGADIVADVRQRYAAFMHQRTTEPPARFTPPAPEGSAVAVGGTVPAVPGGRDELFRQLTAFYAEALEYPEEVFTEDVELEADLGVDSVKQTELISRVAQRYTLPERPDDFRLSDYATLGAITDFVLRGRRTRHAA